MSLSNSVTFETKCYFEDWRFVVKNISRMISNSNYKFDNRVLFINNFQEYSAIKRAADKLIKKNIIDEYYIVSEHADEALNFFGVTKEDFKGGYYYSIAEMVSIYLCKTKYLLHFSGDSIIQNNISFNWIDSGIKLFEKNDDILVCNPTWNFDYDRARHESFNEDDNWFYSTGFSDQAYLVEVSKFKKDIYKETNIESDQRYPLYGGELFEKRVGAYMHNHNLKRITSKHCAYFHYKYPKNPIVKFLKLMGFKRWWRK